MAHVITIGEILVEVMRKKVGVPFDVTGDFVGPFPSGAPAIFADAVANLGKSSSIIGAVGKDGFGEQILERLKSDGVDTSTILKTDEFSTGVAFVTYFKDGSRSFIYHMENSAAGIVDSEDVKKSYFQDADAIHINGCTLAMGERMRKACYKGIRLAEKNDMVISLDPNIRPELGSIEKVREILSPILSSADIVIPRVDEARKITGADKEEQAIEKLISRGVELVALKRGSKGCTLYEGDESIDFLGYDVEEVDPTGAGDAFSAAMVVGMLESMPLERLGKFANAAGAKAVTKKGPMEGIVNRKDIEEMIE